MKHVIVVEGDDTGFTEDKNRAKELRQGTLLPLLDSGETVALDFANVQSATQSFVHALLGEALKKYGVEALDRIEFQNCSAQLKTVIEIVADYSLGGFEPVPDSSSALTQRPADSLRPPAPRRLGVRKK